MVLLMCRFARRVTGWTVLGLVAGLLLSVDASSWCCRGSRCSTSSWRFSRSAACAAWSPTVVAARPAGRRRDTYVVATWLVHQQGRLRAGVRHEVVRGLRSAPSRPARPGCRARARRAFGQHRPLLRSIVLDGAPAFIALRSAVERWRRTSRRGRAGWCTPTPRGRVQRRAAPWYGGGKPVADRERAGRRRPRGVTQSLRSLSCTTTRTSTPSTAASSTTRRTSTPPSRRRGWSSAVRSASTPSRHPARLAGLPGHPRSSASRQVLLLGDPVDLVRRQPRPGGLAAAVDRRRDLASRRRRRRPRQHVASLFAYDDRPIFFFYAITALPFLVLWSRWPWPPDRDIPTCRRRAHLGIVVAGSYAAHGDRVRGSGRSGPTSC